MLLIDAATISRGGGYILLKLLLAQVIEEKVEFRIILNKTIHVKDVSEAVIYRVNVGLRNRGQVIRQAVKSSKATTLLCFCNFPPPALSQEVKVYLYFHRLGLINPFKSENGLFSKLKYRAKALYLKLHLKNTDTVICQSALIANMFSQYFSFPESKIKVLPFYDQQTIKEVAVKNTKKTNGTYVYVSDDTIHKNHIRLIEAWCLLAQAGEFPELYLTLPAGSYLESRVEELSKQGVKIFNLGFMPFKELLHTIANYEYAIFPSLLESLGLGLVEAALLDLKIIGADLPYTYEAVEPSVVFSPFEAESIATAVRKTIEGAEIKPTRLKMESRLPELVELLKN